MEEGESKIRRPIRLTIVMTSPSPEDEELRYWGSIVDALEDVGFDVRILTVQARFLFGSVRRRRGYMEKLRLVSPRLIMTLVRTRPEVVLAIEYGLDTFWCVVAGLLMPTRVLVFQENRHPASITLSLPRRWYRRVVARLADGVIANTRGAEHELHSELKVDRQKVKRISLLSPPPVEALKKGGPPREPSARPLFLFVGQLTELKNVEQLLVAVKLVTKQHLPVALWIVGDGPLGRVLHEMTKTLELQDIVTFHGSVPYSSIGHIFEACDVFVMPSHVEYRSMAVLEAVRFGKPILDSALDGNVGDMVIRGYNGYTFDPRRPSELAERMVRMIRDPGLRRRMGDRSKKLVETQTPAHAAAALYNLAARWFSDGA